MNVTPRHLTLGMTRDEETARLAARQEGLLTEPQATELGWTTGSLARATKAGRILRPEPGVLKVAGAPTTWRQQLLARCLTEGGYASHRAAAALWGLEGFEPRVQDVTVHRWERRPNASVRNLHESTRLTDGDVTEIDGIPCTSIEWTLAHLGAVVSPHQVEMALDDALRRGLTTPARCWAVLQRVAERGVRGVGVIRSLLKRRLGITGPRPNEFERLLYRILDAAGLPLPVPPYEIRTESGMFVARADWAYPPPKRVAIECVSDEWHSGRVRRHRDTTRRNRMQRERYTVLEFTIDHMRTEKAYVAEEVGAHVLA